MPLYAPGGHYQCKLRFRCSGDAEEMISTLAVAKLVDDVEPINNYADGAAGVAHKVAKAWATAWPADRLMVGWTFNGVEARELETGDVGEEPDFVSGANDDSGDSHVPVNVALLVKKKTATAGRRHRGRMYLPSGYLWPGSFSAAGLLTPIALTTFGGCMDAFQTSLEADDADGEGLKAHVLHNTAEGAPLLEPTPIVDFIVDPKIATQRNRLR